MHRYWSVHIEKVLGKRDWLLLQMLVKFAAKNSWRQHCREVVPDVLVWEHRYRRQAHFRTSTNHRWQVQVRMSTNHRWQVQARTSTNHRWQVLRQAVKTILTFADWWQETIKSDGLYFSELVIWTSLNVSRRCSKIRTGYFISINFTAKTGRSVTFLLILIESITNRG